MEPTPARPVAALARAFATTPLLLAPADDAGVPPGAALVVATSARGRTGLAVGDTAVESPLESMAMAIAPAVASATAVASSATVAGGASVLQVLVAVVLLLPVVAVLLLRVVLLLLLALFRVLRL